jgi:hypothetical protein
MFFKNIKVKEKNLFFFYLSFLFLSAIIFLFVKHTSSNDSTISEWLINYQGGFTRRGVMGELAFNLSIFFKAKIRFTIFLLQIFFYLIFIILTFNFFKNIKVNFLTRLAIYTPIFLLYPLAEIESLVRKETIIFIIFIFFLNLAGNKYDKKYCNNYILFIFPISFFIWEPVIFFFPFIFFILYLKNFINNIFQTIIRTLFISLPSLIIFFLIILNPLTEAGHEKMCHNLKYFFEENCYMSLNLLRSKSTIIQQFTYNFPNYKIEYFIRYTLIILIGFFPLIILCANSKLYQNKINFFFKFKSFLLPLIFLLGFTPICYAAMYDWGRVVNISYTFAIFSYFFLIKNNYIFQKKNKFYLLLNSFFCKKKYYYIIFFIFCFCWNVKTVISERVGSFPIYRIITKIIKILLN